MPNQPKKRATANSRKHQPKQTKLLQSNPVKQWKVAISQRKQAKPLQLSSLKRLTRKILSDLDLSNLPSETRELSILFTNDNEIRELNLAWRARDKATDVLSFPSLEGLESHHPAPLSLGDIVISTETARRQARRYSPSLEAEILRLVIHGILHLLGYDHVKVPPAKARQMRRLEAKLMKAYGPELSSFRRPAG